jgi:hypothetical protein
MKSLLIEVFVGMNEKSKALAITKRANAGIIARNDKNDVKASGNNKLMAEANVGCRAGFNLLPFEDSSPSGRACVIGFPQTLPFPFGLLTGS